MLTLKKIDKKNINVGNFKLLFQVSIKVYLDDSPFQGILYWTFLWRIDLK